MSDIAFPPGTPCWVDLFTSDPARAHAFYGEVLGWDREESGPEYGGYVTYSLGGAPVGGAMHNDGSQGVPDVWSVYLATPDIGATLARGTEHGGTVLYGPMDVPRLGHSGMLADVGGAAVGCWQADPFPGLGALGRPGAPGWFELRTREYEASIAFYRDVFAWDPHTSMDTPELRYTTLGQGQDMRAGIYDGAGRLPDGVPSHWAVYFMVEDVDAAVATAGRLGGSVLQPAADTPWGRLAGLADPTGATFSLMSS